MFLTAEPGIPYIITATAFTTIGVEIVKTATEFTRELSKKISYHVMVKK